MFFLYIVINSFVAILFFITPNFWAETPKEELRTNRIIAGVLLFVSFVLYKMISPKFSRTTAGILGFVILVVSIFSIKKSREAVKEKEENANLKAAEARLL